MLTEMGDEVDGDGNEERNRAEESRKGLGNAQRPAVSSTSAGVGIDVRRWTVSGGCTEVWNPSIHRRHPPPFPSAHPVSSYIGSSGQRKMGSRERTLLRYSALNAVNILQARPRSNLSHSVRIPVYMSTTTVNSTRSQFLLIPSLSSSSPTLPSPTPIPWHHRRPHPNIDKFDTPS